jgi:hypothetical protein
LARRDEGRDGLKFALVFTGVLSFICFTHLHYTHKPAQKRLFTRTLQTLVGLFTSANSKPD